jgi:hypothetical protein
MGGLGYGGVAGHESAVERERDCWIGIRYCCHGKQSFSIAIKMPIITSFFYRNMWDRKKLNTYYRDTRKLANVDMDE